MTTVGILAVIAGVFSIVAAAADWDWFMNNHRARPFVAMFGREGARMFYMLLGAVIMMLGLFL